ncbi:MAG: RDD family protein [Candidatus Odinarchaeota archaeon]
MAGWIRIITGLFLLLISFGIIIGGGALLIIQPLFADSDGYLNTPTDEITLPDAEALVFFAEDINIENDFAKTVFDTGNIITLRLRATNLNQSSGFRLYYGPADEARTFLANVTYYEVKDINMDLGWQEGTMDLQTEDTPHSPTVTGNTEVTTWWLEELGTELRIDKFHSSGFAIIIMNPGKEAGITAAIQIGVNLPILTIIAVALMIFGILFLILALLLIIWGATAKPRKLPAGPLDRVRYYSARESAVKEDAGKKILICATCGTENPGDSKYCSECGEPLFSTKEPQIGVRSPEPGAAVTDMVVADGGARFWAWLIDIVIVSLIIEAVKWPFYLFVPTDMFVFGLSFFSLNTVAYFIYWTAMEMIYGQSIGKMALGLEVVTEEGTKPELVQVIVSAAGKAFFLPFDVILGLITKDEQKKKHFGADLEQRLSQGLSRTVVIRKRYTRPETGEKLTFVSGKY